MCGRNGADEGIVDDGASYFAEDVTTGIFVFELEKSHCGCLVLRHGLAGKDGAGSDEWRKAKEEVD